MVGRDRPDYDPLSAGLDWAVEFGKDFIGKSALLDVRKNGPLRLLCLFTIDGFALCSAVKRF